MCSHVVIIVFVKVPELLCKNEMNFSWECVYVCMFMFLITFTVFLGLVCVELDVRFFSNDISTSATRQLA